MTQNDKNPDRGNFVQYPCQLIYNCPNLNRDDKWALLSIMGVCWTDDSYRLSYRDISKLSGIPISLLSSVAGKGGKPDKEGIMDRLQRLEYICCSMGKELSGTTGKPRGNAQTYISVNYKKIWGENTTYKINPHNPQKDFQPVSYTNRFKGDDNKPVSYTNAPVPNTNSPVSYTNAPVRDVSTKPPTYITIDNLDITDKEDTSNIAATETFVANATPPDDEPQRAMRIHPEHAFITLDDPIHPTQMIVSLTPKTGIYYAPMEDERRSEIAHRIAKELQAKHGKLAVGYIHEPGQQTIVVEATTEQHMAAFYAIDMPASDTIPTELKNSEHDGTQPEVPAIPTELATNGLHDTTSTITQPKITTPEIALQREIESSLQTVDELREQTKEASDKQASDVSRIASERTTKHETQQISQESSAIMGGRSRSNVSNHMGQSFGDGNVSATDNHHPGSNASTDTNHLLPSVDQREQVATGTTTKPKRSTRKKKTEMDDIMQKRVEKVYGYFDALKQEVMQKPDARYRRTDSDTEAIIIWLDGHPTEEILREVYLRLWNTPADKRSGFSWKKNMWIHSVLKQYETMEMDIVDERNKQVKRHVVYTVPGAKSTFVPPVEEEDEMPFVLPSELNRKRG